jgi:hypothetical protein
MNDSLLHALHELDPERDAPTTVTVDDERLLATIVAQPRPTTASRRRSPTRRIVVGGLAAAAVVAVGLIRIDIAGQPVGASPAAAAVLERAADVTRDLPAPVTHPGQYLRITLVEVSWSASYDRQPDGSRSVSVGSDGNPATSKERRVRQIWIPHDVEKDWIVRDGTRTVIRTSVDSLGSLDEPQTTTRTPSWAVRGKGHSYLQTYDPTWYASLPRDPDRLTAAIAHAIGAGDGTSTAHLFEEVYAEVLRNGLTPPDIRAALFTAMAHQPGMRVVDRATTLDGRQGVALQAKGSHWQMVFDRRTGAYLGERATDPDFPDVPGLDAAKTTWLSSTRVAVVDSAPRPTD